MTLYIDACRFGTISAYNVSTCTFSLQRLLQESIRRVPSWLDFAVICGHRNQADQDAAFKAGRSKKRWPDGEHNRSPSWAADVRPASPVTAADWGDRLRFARLMGYIEAVAVDLAIPVRLGLDWNRDGRSIDETFEDLGHIEVLVP